jgi:hypothetical protein
LIHLGIPILNGTVDLAWTEKNFLTYFYDFPDLLANPDDNSDKKKVG